MKVLFLNAYFNPEVIAFTHLENDLIEAFVGAGHEIDVICPIPTRGIDKKTVEKYKKIKYKELYDGKVRVHRFWAPQEARNPIIRAFRYLWCNIREYQIGKKFIDIDLIFANSTPPTQGYLAGKLKKKLKCRFLYSLQDIFPSSLVNTGMSRVGSLLYKMGDKISNYTYKNADKIIVISEDFKCILLEKVVPEEKIELIYNWVDENAVVSVPREKNRLFEEYGIDRSKFYIAYSGNIGMTQNMDMLMDVAEELKERTDIGFILVGDGAYKEQVEKIIANRHLTNVTLIPFQPYARISEVFSLGNVGLIISKNGVGSNSVPSKTWSYMSAGRPILASFDADSELCSIIRENNCGVCVDADHKAELKQAIILMAEKDSGEQGKNGRCYIINNLTREIGTKKYISVINIVVDKRST